MSLTDALILGLVQGLTEFIPVSSSGHLIIFNDLLNLRSSFSYDILLNIGTILAASIYFRKELARLLDLRHNATFAKNLAITTVPAMVVGVIVGSFFDDQSRQVGMTAIMLIAVGLLFIFEGRIGKSKYSVNDIRPASAFKIGLAQALAIIPGTSRSGITILAGKQQGLTRPDAARYSFIASIPIISGAVLYSLVFKSTEVLSFDPLVVLVGVVASFVSSITAIHFMVKALQRIGLAPFGWYRVVFGLVLLFVM